MNAFERVWNYAQDIVNGNITACQKHIWAAKRFINDIYNLENENNPYYFDVEVVEDFDEWAKQFVHIEGVLAEQPIILTDFQLFLAANIFGFKKKKNDARRFRKVYIQLARKNAKSQFLALIATYEVFLTNEKHRVYIAGWAKEQSDEVYTAVLDQIRHSEVLKGKYKDSYGKVTRLKTNSIIQPLSKEARKVGDGKNPSVGIVDEYHAHETSEIYDVLISGMVARKQPLMVVITTAGFNLSRPCFKEYDYVSKILDPDNPTENDDYFAVICELDKDDDIKDESNWIKANPIVATYDEGIESLRSDLKTALDQPEKMRSFLTKNMNIWVDKKDDGYLSLGKWNNCGTNEERPMPDIKGKEVYLGIDLSSTIDLTSISFSVPLDDGEYAVFSHSFIPEDKLNERRKTDKFAYDLYVKQRYITVTEGAAIDYRYITKYFEDKVKENNWVVKEIAYDPHQGHYYAQELMEKGYTLVEIKQTITYLSEPTKDFRKLVLQKKIYHENDPVLTWAISNAIVIQNANEDIRLDKSKSTERIDPIASLINAHSRSIYHNFNSALNDHILNENFSF